ncbi:DUF2087 domain-containing protein [Clostridioides difficile]
MSDNNKNELWDSNIEDIKKGYLEKDECYKCLICNEMFIKGRIYEINSYLYDAKKAAEMHIESSHNSMLEYLLNINTVYTGITEVQRELIVLIAQGLTDKEIAIKLGVATSTVRNHRYKLREKEKQAKLFLSMMELLATNTKKSICKMDDEEICDAHNSATTLDDRYNITDKEKIQTIKSYMTNVGALKNFPAKEKKKIIILEEIMKNFSKGKIYSEKDINKTLKRIYEDNATIRRYLIEYGFLDRSKDCSRYWVKE